MKETTIDTMVMLNKKNVSLSSLLAENTPIFINSHGRGALATASFRGTASSHTQVNWNGLNINSPMLGMVDFSLIPVYLIDDINIKHGSSSIADQSGGLGGSININNSVDWDNDFNLKFLQGIGSYSTVDEFLSLGFGNKKIQSKTRLYYNFSKNDYTFVNHAKPEIDYTTGEIIYPLDTNHHAEYNRYGALQEIYYRPSNNNILSLKYWGQYAQRAIPSVSSFEGLEASNQNIQTDIDHRLVADWKYYTSQGKLLVRSGYTNKDLEYYRRYLTSGDKYNTPVHSFSEEQKWFNHIWYSYDIDPTFNINTSLDADFTNVSSVDTAALQGYEGQRSDISLLLAANKSLGEKVNINAMVRQSVVDGELTPTSPFVGIDYKPWDEYELVVKGNAAFNYHQPSLNDLYFQPNGNPDLEAEEGWSQELGIAYNTQWEGLKLETELSTFRSDIENWIVWIPDVTNGNATPENVKNVISSGVELYGKVSGRLDEWGYSVMGNYTYTSAKNLDDTGKYGDESYGKQLIYIPKHSANLMCNISYKGWFLTYQHTSYSLLYTTSSNDLTDRKSYNSYFMNDLMMGRKWQWKGHALDTELKINNLFNEDYISIYNQPMPGINYNFLVTFTL